MSLRQERRRRVIAENVPPRAPDEPHIRLATEVRAEGDPPPRYYSSRTLVDRHRQVHELFPARLLTIGLLTAAGLVVVALLAALHRLSTSLTAAIGQDAVSSLVLSAPGSLGRWFAATLLGLASLVAMFIFSLRRHRLDDYHGRYRVWVWAVALCLLASMAETTRAGSLAEALCHKAAVACGVSPSVAWPATLAIVISAMLLRLLVEVWRCRTAAATLALASVGFLAAAGAGFRWIALADPLRESMVVRCSWLAGYVLAVTAFLLYARHVVREIEGLVVMRPAKPRRARKGKAPAAEASEAPDESRSKQQSPARSDLDPVAVAPTDGTGDPLRVDAPHEGGRDDSTSDRGAPRRKLSRAERRRLRREANRNA